MRIGVDLMGSDCSPDVLFDAVLDVAREMGNEEGLVVFVVREVFSELLKKKLETDSDKYAAAKVDVHLTGQYISMADDPLSSVRIKKDSTLSEGIAQLRQGNIDAFVSAGNTGALVACASIRLNPLGSMDRSALLAVLPTHHTPLAVIDVGGNVTYRAEHLVQYAHLGAAFQRCSLGIERPRIGLLNIGVESGKGTKEIQEAYQILERQARRPDAGLQFVGNVEGHGVFEGLVDVLVTDGFTGNVFLKTSEGVSGYIFDHMQRELQGSPSKELHAALDALQSRYKYEEHPGALLCGVDGIVIKCHGTATRKAMYHTIQEARNLVKNRFLESLKDELREL